MAGSVRRAMIFVHALTSYRNVYRSRSRCVRQSLYRSIASERACFIFVFEEDGAFAVFLSFCRVYAYWRAREWDGRLGFRGI